MGISDIIIIKSIITYCPSACSIHRYSEAVAHASRRLKPHLLLSNHCHVEFINLVSGVVPCSRLLIYAWD